MSENRRSIPLELKYKKSDFSSFLDINAIINSSQYLDICKCSYGVYNSIHINQVLLEGITEGLDLDNHHKSTLLVNQGTRMRFQMLFYFLEKEISNAKFGLNWDCDADLSKTVFTNTKESNRLQTNP